MLLYNTIHLVLYIRDLSNVRFSLYVKGLEKISFTYNLKAKRNCIQ